MIVPKRKKNKIPNIVIAVVVIVVTVSIIGGIAISDDFGTDAQEQNARDGASLDGDSKKGYPSSGQVAALLSLMGTGMAVAGYGTRQSPSIENKIKCLLPNDANNVAVLYMVGSLCPVTKAHLQTFEVAKKELFERAKFDAVIGVIDLNSESHLRSKLGSGSEFIWLSDLKKREELLDLAIKDVNAESASPWLQRGNREDRDLEGKYLDKIFSSQKVRLVFDHFDKQCKVKNSFVTVGRPGDTDRLKEAVAEYKRTGLKLIGCSVDEFDNNFIIVDMNDDMSSTEVRKAMSNGNMEKLEKYLHPQVLGKFEEFMKEQ